MFRENFGVWEPHTDIKGSQVSVECVKHEHRGTQELRDSRTDQCRSLEGFMLESQVSFVCENAVPLAFLPFAVVPGFEPRASPRPGKCVTTEL